MSTHIDCVGYGTTAADKPLTLMEYKIPVPTEEEVIVRVAYCGLCHSDVHTARNEWGNAAYPVVPGHEMVGYVDKLGSAVTRVKVGDIVGIGCMVDSCRGCAECNIAEEQHCTKLVYTYGTVRKEERFSWPTTGGYGNYVLCHSKFVFPIPKELPLDKVAPLLCAGITTYNPVVTHRMDRGNLKIGINGAGGLGHMAIQFASKINSTNNVYVLSRTKGKEALAQKLGAKKMISTKSAEEMAEHTRTFDYILDTVPANHDYVPLLGLLKPRGSLLLVGCPSEPLNVRPFDLVVSSKSICASVIGGTKMTQEMLEFCAKHNILPMVEEVPLASVNEAFERMIRGDVQFRFVVNVEKSLK